MFTPFHSQSVRRIFHISAFFSPKKRPFYDIWVQTPHDICSSTLCEPMCCDYCYFAFVSLGYLFCKLSVRISNLTKSFLLSQRRNARRLFRTTSLAGGFLHTKIPALRPDFSYYSLLISVFGELSFSAAKVRLFTYKFFTQRTFSARLSFMLHPLPSK